MKQAYSIIFSLILAFNMVYAKANDPWIQLFNGKNLKGWKIVSGTGKFEVKDGVIVATSVLKTSNTFLITEKNYSDFILEYDMLMTKENMNSGVQFRSHLNEKGKLYGLQTECDGTKRAWTGGIYDERRHGWLYSLEYNQEAKSYFKIGQWNKFRIEAIGNRIRTFVNNKPVADLLTDYDTEGTIGLQLHSIYDEIMAGSQIKWKNIRILTENPSAHTLPESNIRQVNYLKNVLSEREKAEGWKLLWDGKTSKGWRSHKSDIFPKKGWNIKDGILTVEKSDGGESTNGGDIITTKKYRNFILEVDFLITKGANSGIKYFVDPDLNTGKGSAIGCEFQILDDNVHPDAKKGVNGNRTVGALYDLIAPNGKFFNPHLYTKRFNSTGAWNRVRIEVRGGQVIHVMNGSKIVEYNRFSQMWKALVAYSKYKDWPNFGEAESGYILLQDHGDKVSFKNVKIKELD